ncbi:hypothetical protein G2W53_015933 [Senna tora]|uniref:RNase H type-1 domain-containing protein n=1 Tax=Senna tora TaxID=362788 RepID=A0A834WVP6_9FABA|nr:hypothetical protein G2W53_015933 [Senna tora]
MDAPRIIQEPDEKGNELSTEEKDQLRRSNKKMKTDGETIAAEGDLQMIDVAESHIEIPQPEEGMMGGITQPNDSPMLDLDLNLVSKKEKEEAPDPMDKNTIHKQAMGESKVEVGDDAFGPWMMAQKNTRRKPRPRSESRPRPGISNKPATSPPQEGSRFNVLDQEESHDDQMEQDTPMSEQEPNPYGIPVVDPVIQQIVPVQQEPKNRMRKHEKSTSASKTQPPSEARKTSKNPQEKATNHTVVIASPNSKKQQVLVNPIRSPPKPLESSGKASFKGLGDPPKVKQKKPPDYNESLELIRSSERALKASGKSVFDLGVTPIYDNSFIQEWVLLNLMDKDPIWPSTFSIICWLIWKHRNNWVFNKAHKPIFSIVHSINYHTKAFLDCGLLKHSSWSPSESNKNMHIKWKPPECGSLKFNVDGSCWRHNSSISCGGVLRDSDGRWITGFVRRMGKGNSLTAEMWAIYSSLQIAWDNRLKDIIIETDSLLAITLIKDGVDRFHPLKPLVSAICNLADRIGNINFTHSFREGNRVANALASSGHCMDFGLYSLDIPPSSCILLVEDDIRGVLFPRGFAG